MKNPRLARELVAEIEAFLSEMKSLMLAVPNEQAAIASYAPFVVLNDRFYILVSELAQHTKALRETSLASVLIIEDESQSASIFARRRLQYEVSVQGIPVASETHTQASSAMLKRHGDVVAQLLQLSDFHMFELRPENGRFVKGFGRAYELAPKSLVSDQLDHLRR